MADAGNGVHVSATAEPQSGTEAISTRTGHGADVAGASSFWTTDRIGWFLALLIGCGVAAALEAWMIGYAIPPGQDQGEWIVTSYAYVGMPTPSQIVPLAYPPALFPYLGFLVRLTGGPIGASLAFVGTIAIFLGLATYFLAKVLLRGIALALFVEAAFLLYPSTLRIFFWGGFPTLFGVLFVALSLAYLISFIRAGKWWQATLFWVCAAIAILSESLVAATFTATLLFFGILLLATRRFPSRLLVSRGGVLGWGIFGLAVGSYYIGSDLEHVAHANYAQASAYAHTLTTLSPFYSPLVGPVLPKLSPSSDAVFASLLILVALLIGFLIFLRWVRPRALNETSFLLAAWGLAGLTIAIAGWQFNVITVYGRIAYLLILPFLLGVGFLARVAFRRIVRALPDSFPNGLSVEPEPTGRAPLFARWAPAARRDPLLTVGLVLGTCAILLFAAEATFPSIAPDERFFAQPGHDGNYSSALQSIGKSNVSGGILVGVPETGRWPRALDLRNTYSPLDPAILGTQDFYPNKVLDSELAYFALSDEYEVGNGLVSGTFAGPNGSLLTGVPDYVPFYYGHAIPILRLLPTSLAVKLPRGQTVPIYDGAGPGPKVLLPPSGRSWIGFEFQAPGLEVTVDARISIGTPAMQLEVYANSTTGTPIDGVSFTLAQETGQSAIISVTPSTDSFAWTPSRFTALETLGSVLGPGVSVTEGGGGSATRSVEIAGRISGAAATSHFSLSVELDTPGATNIIAPSSLPPFLSAPQVWKDLDVSFVLLGNSSLPKNYPLTPPQEAALLQLDLGATLYYGDGAWFVFELHDR